MARGSACLGQQHIVLVAVVHPSLSQVCKYNTCEDASLRNANHMARGSACLGQQHIVLLAISLPYIIASNCVSTILLRILTPEIGIVLPGGAAAGRRR